jgi:hypothetical protein
LQQIVDFVIDNYEDAPSYLIPQTVEELLEKNGNAEIVISEDDYGIDGLSFFRYISPTLVESFRTVTRMDVRSQGISKNLNETMENMLKNLGVSKIKCHIYADNYISLFRRVKMGYLIEGLLRNHDTVGQHEYILGKEL